MKKPLITKKDGSPGFFGLALILLCSAVSGCGTTDGGSGLFDKALNTVGLQRSSLRPNASANPLDASATAAAPASSAVALRIHAGDVLNTDASGRSLSVVVRIYRLRDSEAFENATHGNFFASGRPTDFAADVVGMREVVMTPGKTYEVREPAGRDAPYLAVVALFRRPADRRWKYIFDAKTAARSGITVGLHACAMTVAAGDALGAPPESMRLTGVRCADS